VESAAVAPAAAAASTPLAAPAATPTSASTPVSPAPPSAPATAPHTTAGKLAELNRRTEEHVHAGSAAAVERQHAKGKRTARERIDM
jgi:propionyl-CoA carboxylase beta chain